MRTATVLPAAVALLALGCGSSPAPTAPGAVSSRPDSSGVWQIEYRVTNCMTHYCSIGNVLPATLRLVETAASVTGVFHGEVTGDVAGTRDAAGDINLTGITSAASAAAIPGQVEVRITLRRNATGFSGTVKYWAHFPPDVGLQPRACGTVCYGEGEIVRANQTSARAPSSFGGTWRGRFVVRQCSTAWSGIPSARCYPNEVDQTYAFELSFPQADGLIAGTLRAPSYAVPVSAMVNGGVLTLTGEVRDSPANPPLVIRIVSFSASRDAVGRLRGSFRFIEEYLEKNGPPLVSGTFDAELVSVVLID